jgi:hypothetical protein
MAEKFEDSNVGILTGLTIPLATKVINSDLVPFRPGRGFLRGLILFFPRITWLLINARVSGSTFRLSVDIIKGKSIADCTQLVCSPANQMNSWRLRFPENPKRTG